MDSTLFRFTTPPSLVAVDAPSEVIALYHLGEVAILGGADDDELDKVGLNQAAVTDHLAQLAHADAEALRTIWGSRSGQTLSWLTPLIERLEPLSDGWRSTLTGAWATTSSFLPSTMLVSGNTGTRTGLLMFLTGTGATAFDVQTAVTALAETMAAEKPSLLEKSALMGTSFLGGQALDLFLGGVGATILGEGVKWSGDKLSRQLTGVEPWIEELALTYTLALGLKHDEPERVQKVISGLREAASGISRAQPSASQTKRIKLLLWTQRALLKEQGSGEGQAMPNLVGLRLSDAKEILKTLGFTRVTITDAAKPAAEARSPRIESRWQVRGHLPPEGGPLPDQIVLAYSKPDEPILPAVMHKNLSSHIVDGHH